MNVFVKALSTILLVFLTGCGSLGQMSMLETAPQNDSQLMYPDWGDPEPEVTAGTPSNIEGPYGQKRSDELNALLFFLSQQGIEHEVIPGGHLMIKLKEKINFQTGSAFISKSSRQWLEKLSLHLSGQANVDIVIDGHTDSTGATTLNDNLSERRALQVKQELLTNKVAAGAIYTRGYGEYSPACTNSTMLGKACNRRVELTFIIASY